MREVLRAAANHLRDAQVASPRVDAELLAAHVCGLERVELALADVFPPEKLGRYWELVERRAERVPLQHLTGETGFRFLTLGVRPGVFVPRPETEMVAEAAIEAALLAAPGARIVDLCTGAGGIAISCAKEVPSARVWAADISARAVALTEENAERNDCQVHVIQADVRNPRLFDDLAGSVDVVVSNPPYIPFQSEPIDVEVRNFDPPAALYGGGEDGLEIPTAVIDRGHSLLKPGGLLVIEHGDEQADAMRDLVAKRGGFREIHTRADLTNRDRMVVAIRDQVAH